MKALTIHQPWAELIAKGRKRVENRGWATSYRGPLAIHAGKQMSDWDRQCHKFTPRWSLPKNSNDLAKGAIVAVAHLYSCVSLTDAKNFEKPHPLAFVKNHEFTQGPFCWILVDVVRVDPIPCRGFQGLWKVDIRMAEVLTDIWEDAAQHSSSTLSAWQDTEEETQCK